MVYHTVHSWPMAGKDPRGRLLDAAIDHIAARGVTDLSLRELAAAIGTSHRMLIHHFGSREGLWVEVIRAVEQRQRASLAEVVPGPDAAGRRSDAAVVARTSPTRAVAQRAAVLRALRPGAAGPAGNGRAAGRDRRQLARAGAQGFVAYGLEREEALAQARLGLAVSRGLLLDLLATGDREAVDAANGGLHRPRRGTTGRISRSPFAGPTLESAHTTRRGHRRAGGACASGPGTRGAAAVLRRARQRAGRDAAGGHARARAAPRRPGGRRARPGHEDPAHAGAAGRHAQRPGLRRRCGGRAALRAREPRRARAHGGRPRHPAPGGHGDRRRHHDASAGARLSTGSPPPTASCASTSTATAACSTCSASPASGLDVDTTPVLTAGEAVRVVQDDAGVYRALPAQERHAVGDLRRRHHRRARPLHRPAGVARDLPRRRRRRLRRDGRRAHAASCCGARTSSSRSPARVWDEPSGRRGRRHDVNLDAWLTDATARAARPERARLPRRRRRRHAAAGRRRRARPLRLHAARRLRAVAVLVGHRGHAQPQPERRPGLLLRQPLPRPPGVARASPTTSKAPSACWSRPARARTAAPATTPSCTRRRTASRRRCTCSSGTATGAHQRRRRRLDRLPRVHARALGPAGHRRRRARAR